MYKYLMVGLIGILTSLSSYADLVSMDDETLSSKQAQNGIIIDNELYLNRKKNVDAITGKVTIGKETTCNENSNDCEYAIRLAGSDSWLTIYDLSGGVNLKNLKVEATQVSETDTTPALEIGDTSGNINATIDLDYFGADSWGFASNGPNVEGYRVLQSSPTTGLDRGKPYGFYELRMQGKLTMTGGLKIFNCKGVSSNSGC